MCACICVCVHVCVRMCACVCKQYKLYVLGLSQGWQVYWDVRVCSCVCVYVWYLGSVFVVAYDVGLF